MSFSSSHQVLLTLVMPKKDRPISTASSMDTIGKQDSEHVHFQGVPSYNDLEETRKIHAGDSFAEGGRQSLVDSIRESMRSLKEATKEGTVFGTVMNILCNVMGTGILALPLAIHNASVVIGIITILYSTSIGILAVYVLVKGVDYTGTATLAEIFALTAYPKREASPTRVTNGDVPPDESKLIKKRSAARWFVELTIFFLNFGTIVVYGKAIEEAMPPVVEGFLHGHGVWVNKWFWLGISAIVFYVPTCARQMASLKWTSLIGALTIFYVAIVVFIKFFTLNDPITISPSCHMMKLDVSIFEALTTFAVAYGFNYNVPPFYDELINKNPKTMMKCVAISFPIITISYIAAGVAGYMTFGHKVAESQYGGNILKMYSNSDIVVGIARLGLFPALALSFPVLAVGLRQVLHRIATMLAAKCLYPNGVAGTESAALYPEDEENPGKQSMPTSGAWSQDPMKQPFWVIGLEAFVIVAGSIMTAAFVPGIGLVIEIVGALFGIWIMMIFPGIIGMFMWSGARADEELHGGFIYSKEGLAGHDVPRRRFLYVCSVICFVSGILCTIAGAFSIVWGLLHKHDDSGTSNHTNHTNYTNTSAPQSLLGIFLP